MTLARGQIRRLRLILHELATNAVKHGALSSPRGGCGSAGGTTRRPTGGGRRLRLRWEEQGGPRVQPPAPAASAPCWSSLPPRTSSTARRN